MQDILEKMALCKYIDTHAHVYDVAFGGDEEAVIERALAAGVGLILQADIDSSERVRMIDLAAKYPLVLRNMAGLYPGSVNGNWEQEVAAVEKYAVEGNVVAIEKSDWTIIIRRIRQSCRNAHSRLSSSWPTNWDCR